MAKKKKASKASKSREPTQHGTPEQINPPSYVPGTFDVDMYLDGPDIGHVRGISSLVAADESIEEHLSKIRQRARHYCTDIDEKYQQLRSLLHKDGSRIFKRWRQKAPAKRKKMLLIVRPGLPESYSPDIDLYLRIKSSMEADLHRDTYLMPYLNTIDLSKTRSLPLFLQTRANNKPSSLAPSDLICFQKFMKCEIAQPELPLMESYVMRAFATSGRDTVHITDPNIAYASDGLDTPVFDGLMILKVQETIFQFLLDCCNKLIEEDNEVMRQNKKSNLHLLETNESAGEEHPDTEQSDMTLFEAIFGNDGEEVQDNKIVERIVEAQYLPPSKPDWAQVERNLEMAKEGALDQLRTLREDPEIFADTIREYELRNFSRLQIDLEEELNVLRSKLENDKLAHRTDTEMRPAPKSYLEEQIRNISEYRDRIAKDMYHTHRWRNVFGSMTEEIYRPLQIWSKLISIVQAIRVVESQMRVINPASQDHLTSETFGLQSTEQTVLNFSVWNLETILEVFCQRIITQIDDTFHGTDGLRDTSCMKPKASLEKPLIRLRLLLNLLRTGADRAPMSRVQSTFEESKATCPDPDLYNLYIENRRHPRSRIIRIGVVRIIDEIQRLLYGSDPSPLIFIEPLLLRYLDDIRITCDCLKQIHQHDLSLESLQEINLKQESHDMRFKFAVNTYQECENSLYALQQIGRQVRKVETLQTRIEMDGVSLEEASDSVNEMHKLDEQAETEDISRMLAIIARTAKLINDLGTPNGIKFNYPIHKSSTKENVEQLISAENNLDEFWTAFDQYLAHMSTQVRATKQLLVTRWLGTVPVARRTPDWTPERSPTLTVLCQQSPLSTSVEFGHGTTQQDTTFVAQGKKLKKKTKGEATPLSAAPDTAVQPAEPRDENDQALKDKIFVVKPKIYDTLMRIFRRPGGIPSSVQWVDFRNALIAIGFGVESRGGSIWLFIPGPGLEGLPHGITFHRPHPNSYYRASDVLGKGRRLTQHYGWTRRNFQKVGGDL